MALIMFRNYIKDTNVFLSGQLAKLVHWPYQFNNNLLNGVNMH